MKKNINILLLMGVLLMALSCIEAEGLNENPEGEITMSPVLSQIARTRAGGTTSYPKDSSFGVFAYYNGSEAYLKNHQFTCNDDGCTGTPKAYWPLSGSLIFAGYSPFDEEINAGFDVGTKTLTISDYVVDGKKDLMYFLPELDGGNYVSYDKSAGTVDVGFHHALSCVSFNVSAGPGGGEVKLKQIKLNSVPHIGDFSVDVGHSSVGWGDLSSYGVMDVMEYDAEGVILSPSTPFYAEAFVLPGTASKITVVYQIGTEPEQSEIVSPEDTWSIGTNNIYDITINSMGELIISPSASISHKYESDILKGTEVTVNLGNLTSEERERITDIQIVVSSGSTVYKRYSLDKVPDSNIVTFMRGNSSNPEENRLYLPKGDGKYTVTVTYNDGLGNRSVSVNNISSDDPIFKFNVKVGTQPSKLTIRSAVISISDEVLSELNAELYMRFNNEWYYQGAFVSKSQCITNETRALSPIEDYKMTQTGVIFDGVPSMAEENASSYTVPRKYSIGTIVSDASNLQNGKKYVIRLHKNSSTAGWSCEGEESLKHRIVPSDNIGIGYVFIYERDDSRKNSSLDVKYNSSSAGAWVSNYDWKYLQDNDSFSFSNTPAYFTCANRWGSDTGTDIDIYRESGSGMLNYYSGYKWGNYGTDYYKWDIFEVNEDL